MPADINKQTIIQVVHGVQTTDNPDDLNQHEDIRKLIDRALAGTHFDFSTEMYRYEQLNDKVTALFERLASALFNNVIAAKVTAEVVELVGDVVINLADGSTATQIRQGLKNRILEHFDNGNPCYVVAHSLGTIYAFDVINELMKDKALFQQRDRSTWPVQGFVTFGSPIGLDIFRKNGRESIVGLGFGVPYFVWKNYWDVSDPVVSGNVFGMPRTPTKKIAENYMKNSDRQGWFCQDFATYTGKTWLPAHTAYWNDFTVGQGLVSMFPRV